MTFHAAYSLTFPSPSEARVVEEALAVETELPRSRTVIKRDGSICEIEIEAQDVTALRAATNSFLKWARTAQSLQERLR